MKGGFGRVRFGLDVTNNNKPVAVKIIGKQDILNYTATKAVEYVD